MYIVECALYMYMYVYMPVYALLCDISSKGHGGKADKWFQHHPPWKTRQKHKIFTNQMLLATKTIFRYLENF